MQIHEITTLNENFLSRMAKQARDDAFKKATGVDWKTYKLAQGDGEPAAAPVQPRTAPTPAPPPPQTAAPAAEQPPPLTPEQIRKAKQAMAAKAAQDQMAAKTTGEPEVLDPVAKAAQKPSAAKSGDVFDVDARVVSDPARLPQPAARLPQPAARLPAPATTVPNYAQTNKVGYRPATVNAPVATVPNMPVTVPPKPAAPAAPVVNQAAKPQVYVWDGQPLNPNNPVHARLIAQMQAAGVTKAKTQAPKR